MVNRSPVVSGLLWLLRATCLVMVLLMVIYFVFVQANAIAYLVGMRNTGFGGASPPVPIRNDPTAIVNIVVGLFFEAIAALIFFVALVMLRQAIRDQLLTRRRRRERRAE